MPRAVTSFFAAMPDGSERYVAAGEVVDAKDPLLKGREALFSDALGAALPEGLEDPAGVAEPERPETRGPAAKKAAAKAGA